MYCFAKTGATPLSNEALKAAKRKNKYVITIIKNLEKEFEENDGSYYTIGGKDEANYYISNSISAWAAIPDALLWLLKGKL